MTPLKRLLWMLALTMLWSPSFLFVKLALQDLPPMTLVASRLTLAALIFIAILAWRKISVPCEWQFWVRMGGMALLASVIPFCLIGYAEQSIDSALAAILIGTSPMFTAILAQIFVPSDRMTMGKAVGVLLSCAGVVLLFAPKLGGGVSGSIQGMIAMLIASVLYSSSHIYAKLYFTELKPPVAPATQLMMASAILLPLAIFYDEAWTLPIPSQGTLWAVVSLALPVTVVGFIIYYKLLDKCGPTAVSSVACIVPAVGMLLGYVFLDETFTSTALEAAAVIFVGMLLVNEVISLDFLRKRNEAVIDETPRL